MKKSIHVFTLAALVLALGGRAEAAQLKLFLGGAVTQPVRKIGAEFTRKTSHQIDINSNTSGALQKMLESGAKADVVIVASGTMDALEKNHLIMPGTRFDVALGLIGVGIRPGAKVPDLSSTDAFKKTMLAARSVSFVDPKSGGTSGTHIAKVLDQMGIAAQMQKKIVYRTQGSEVADAVAKGDAEIGITFTSELAPNKGVKVSGVLPDSIQLPTNYSVAIPAGAPNADAARAFLQELKSSQAQAAFKEAGLEPIK